MHLFQALAPIVKGSENSFYQFLGRESCQLQMLCYCIHCYILCNEKERYVTEETKYLLQYDLVLTTLGSQIFVFHDSKSYNHSPPLHSRT